MRFTTLNLSELGKKSNPMFAGTVGLGKNRVTALLTWKLALLPSVHQTEPRLDRLA
jgi:hypothetical protein